MPSALNARIQWQRTQWIGSPVVRTAPMAWPPASWTATSPSSSPHSTWCGVADRAARAVSDQSSATATGRDRIRSQRIIGDQSSRFGYGWVSPVLTERAVNFLMFS